MDGSGKTARLGRPTMRLVGAACAVLIAACDWSVSTEGSAAGSTVDEHWKLVQAYIDTDTAWHAKEKEIRGADIPAKDKRRRRKEERGDHPDIMLAVDAAKTILSADDHPQFVAAAEFLMSHPRGAFEGASEVMTLGADALAKAVGPDRQLIDRYVAARTQWAEHETADADEEEQQEQKALGDPPTPFQAIAAALALLRDAESDAERRSAAEFLLNDLKGQPNANAYVHRAANTALEHFPDFDWPMVLANLDASRYRADEKIDAFFEKLANQTADPVARATARYFLAKGILRSADAFSTTPEDRAALRERALAAAAGLAAGVEEAELLDLRVYDSEGEPVSRPMTEVEADLVHRIKHTTVGGTLPVVAAKRLDGTDDDLANYAGKVVLIDFWATWCGPCVAALPKLRDMVEKLPSDRFALLSVSVDEELEEVTEFQVGEPMPWANWHVGEKSELGEQWDVRAYPTYVLVDGDGVIQARTSGRLSDEFVAVVEKHVNAGQLAPSATDA